MGGGGGGSEGPTEEERALAEKGAREWNRFVKDFAPVVHESVREHKAADSDFRDIGAQTSAHVAQELPAGTDLAEGAPRGPAGGAFKAAMASGANAHAGAVGTARAGAHAPLQGREMQGLMSAAAVGRGVEGAASSSMANVGRQATSQGIQHAQQKAANAQEFRQGLISAGAGITGAVGQSRGWWDLNAAPSTKPVPKGN